jgi:hypothetical protein
MTSKTTNPQAGTGPETDRVMVRLWPTVGRALDLTRGATYDLARTGTIPTTRYGKLLRVSASWLRRQGQADDK